MPAISILLPTYDGAPFLPEQLQSILAQELEDLELIVADDGSTDGTPALLAAAARADRRVRLVPTSGNRGQKRRLLELRALVRAPLIAVADQDDRWAPDKLRLLAEDIGGHAMVFGSSWLIDAEGRALGRTIMDSLVPAPSPGDRLLYLFEPRVSAHAMLARREIFSDPSLRRAEAFDWLQSLDAAFGAGGLAYLPAARTFHRLHGGNQSNADLGSRPSLSRRLTPGHYRMLHGRRGFARRGFAQRLEHLAASDLLDESVRQRFDTAQRLCRHAWFALDRSGALPAARLRAVLGELLLPLAGSPGDAARGAGWLARLCRSPHHPDTAVRNVGLMLRGG